MLNTIEQGISFREIRESQAEMDMFAGFKNQWAQDTYNTYPEVEHPAFRGIVTMGEIAVPLILEELKEKPSWLYFALEEITGENPVEETGEDSLEDISSRWLWWGEQRGYIKPS